MEQIKVDNIQTGEIKDSVVRPMVSSDVKPSGKMKSIILIIVIVLLGVASGYGLYSFKTAGTVRVSGKDVEVVKSPTEEGVKDAAAFKDTATGKLIVNDGKLSTEGTHILNRGNADQNVYLTSSVVDLSKYEGKQVQIWGSTFESKKSGWLMDVGRIKLVQ